MSGQKAHTRVSQWHGGEEERQGRGLHQGEPGKYQQGFIADLCLKEQVWEQATLTPKLVENTRKGDKRWHLVLLGDFPNCPKKPKTKRLVCSGRCQRSYLGAAAIAPAVTRARLPVPWFSGRRHLVRCGGNVCLGEFPPRCLHIHRDIR